MGAQLGLKWEVGLENNGCLSPGKQEEPRIRSQHVPRNHWRGQENTDFRQATGHIRAGRPSGRGLLYPERQVKLTVVSKTGREATIGILTDGKFFGEGALAGQPLRMDPRRP